MKEIPVRVSTRHMIRITAILLLSFVATVRASDPGVNGELSKLGDLPVLRVWGTPAERGEALGYHFADEIAALLDGYISNPASGGVEQYERMVAFARRTMSIDPRYEAEFKGIVKGIRVRKGMDPELRSLGRSLNETDLLTFNCLPELSMLGCSSFAVWGAKSGVNGTLAGRNLDWHALEPLMGTQVVVVHEPSDDGKRLGWVSVTWPSFTGCLTGMNSDGVTVSMHDVSIGAPPASSGFVPRGFALRDAIESARAKTAFDDVAKTLRARRCAVGNNIPVNRPSRTGGIPSAVFEYDGNLAVGGGITMRQADSMTHLFCTNHYVNRATPRQCRRYETIDRQLDAITKSDGTVGLAEGWKILRSVAFRGQEVSDSIVTLYSVLFEPDRCVMHVATAAKGRTAHEAKPVELDVKDLLRK